MLTELQTVFIYALKDPRDGAVRYIGKTDNPERRFKAHRRAKLGTYKDNWIVSLRAVGIVPTMEIIDSVPANKQDFFERAYIKVYKESGFKLTNLTEGGDGGKIICPEVLARMAAKRRGSRRSPETRKKMSEAQIGPKNHRFGKPGTNLGATLSSETCAKISASKLGTGIGRKHCAAAKEKMSAAHSGEKNPMFGKTGPDAPNFGKHLTDAQKLHLSIKQSAFQQKKKAAKSV